MSEDNLQSHVDDILNVLKRDSDKEVPREEIESELEKFMEYGVPIEQAKQTLLKKYGSVSVLTSSTPSERTLIADLKPNESSIKLLGHVVAINPKEITVKGENRTIFYGILGDESGTVPFTAWSKLDVDKGDVIEILNAYTREWQGAVQLNFGDRVKVEKTDKSKLPKSAFEPKTVKVSELKSGIGRVDVTARITDLREREVEIDGNKKTIFSGNLADETGKAQFTSWEDFKIKEGDVLQINGGYVKSWKGIPQLTFDSNAKVKKLDSKEIPKKEIKLQKLPLYELVEKKGALDVDIEGTIIEIRSGSGVILRCPECNRALYNGECSIHGKVKGKEDLRIKLVIDDGTGTVSTSLNRELTEKILGKSLEECKKMKNEDLLDESNNELFAKKLRLKGNALGDEFGTNLIAQDAEIIDVDIEAEAEKLVSEMEDIL
jgi:replication factor A1